MNPEPRPPRLAEWLLTRVVPPAIAGESMLGDRRQDELPHWLRGGLPPEAILYAAALAAFTALVVGVLPALQATGRRLQSTLREIGGGTGLRMGRTWTVLMCLQVAVAVGVLPGVASNRAPPRGRPRDRPFSG
jgi:hypothetical protein